jgi:hypothetical protein
MSIEESKQYIASNYGWQINEATFKVIEEETCVWVAEVTATHSGHSFFILVQYGSFFTIEKRWRHQLGDWFNTWL